MLLLKMKSSEKVFKFLNYNVLYLKFVNFLKFGLS